MQAKLAWLVVLCFLAFPGLSAALVIDLEGGEKIVVPRNPGTERIRVDGHLKEAIWQAVPAYDEFVVIEPDTMGAVPHKTLVRFIYGDDGLYVAVDMEQPQETLTARLSGRDQRQINRDSISITLDTSGEGRYGYWFAISLGDSLMDGTVLPERQFTSDWDGAWRGATQATATGWTAEIFVPWGTVSMPQAGAGVRNIGLYMSRKVAYLDERWGWPALPDTIPKFMSVLQPLEFTGVNPKQQYSIFPFVSVASDRIDGEIHTKVGADFFWRPSTNFQLLGTLKPDFGSVESDDVVINLTATETFFPEKRLFFLEGQEVFFASPRADTRGGGVGNAGSPTTLVNTRRIGGKPRAINLPPGGTLSKREEFRPVELYGAVKMIGQAGSFRYGVLGASEEDLVIKVDVAGTPVFVPQSGSDYGVVRAIYEDSANGGYRALGVLSTAVVNDDLDSFAHSVDGHYLSADGKYKFDVQAFMSDIDGIKQGYGGFFDTQINIKKGVSQRFGIEYFDKTVDINALGYLQRNDNLRFRSSHIRTSSNLGWARDNQFDLRGFAQRNGDGYYTGGGIFVSDRLTFNNLTSVTGRLNFNTPAYDDLNSFGNGIFRVDAKPSAALQYDSNPTGVVSYDLSVSYSGEDLGGDNYGAAASLVWNPNDQFTLKTTVKYNDRRGWLLHSDNRYMTTYDAEQWVPAISADYFLTARQAIRASLQWVGIRAHERDSFEVPLQPGDLVQIAKPTPGSKNFALSQLSFQVRYRWEIAPLSDLFVVYTRVADRGLALRQNSFEDVFNEGWDNPIGDVFIVKARYRFGS